LVDSAHSTAIEQQLIFYETSALSGHHVNDLFDEVLSTLLEQAHLRPKDIAEVEAIKLHSKKVVGSKGKARAQCCLGGKKSSNHIKI